jgi:hypothetical protein
MQWNHDSPFPDKPPAARDPFFNNTMKPIRYAITHAFIKDCCTKKQTPLLQEDASLVVDVDHGVLGHVGVLVAVDVHGDGEEVGLGPCGTETAGFEAFPPVLCRWLASGSEWTVRGQGRGILTS